MIACVIVSQATSVTGQQLYIASGGILSVDATLDVTNDLVLLGSARLNLAANANVGQLFLSGTSTYSIVVNSATPQRVVATKYVCACAWFVWDSRI